MGNGCPFNTVVLHSSSFWTTSPPASGPPGYLCGTSRLLSYMSYTGCMPLALRSLDTRSAPAKTRRRLPPVRPASSSLVQPRE